MNIKKKTPPFCGVGTALVTPFRDGEIDLPTLRTLVDRQYRGGADALVVCGTTGESVTMTKAEKAAALDTVLSECGGKLPIVMGTGSADTREAVRASREAEERGADALLVVTPYYNKGTKAGLLGHYLSIAEAVDLPIILYNVPGRPGVDLGIDLLRELAGHENITAIKEASGNINRCADIVATLGEALPLYSGNDAEILPTLALGGIGIISVVSNLLPVEVKRLVTL
ncbi:MAG: 4-hydroxy-tetrahydrodipicolinate synthase, partial [Clostridia bacterium]|nr:4-hydroxy-tetrahydrodipicolinate synthase [Clostridia bacterium]